MQIADWLELEILQGNIGRDEKIYSQYQLAEMFHINPATAAKGLNLLADENILYKKRGLGMFVAADAKTLILDRRKNHTLQQLLWEVLREAERLGLDDNQLLEMIKAARNQREES